MADTGKTKLSERVTGSLAAGIVRIRYIIFVLFIIAGAYCVLSIGKVKIDPDFRSFLPKESETRKGLAVMDSEFESFASASVMIEDITYEEALGFADRLSEIPHVTSVGFDDTDSHYVSSSALFDISFDGKSDDPKIISAMNEVNAAADEYRSYIKSSIGDSYSKILAREMVGVLLIAAIVIVFVLLLTSRSYFEVVIFAIVFLFAALLNAGTNHWFGTISSITNSVAVILQLALAIDYAIIFGHRYQDESEAEPNPKRAISKALSRSMIEIFSSSLTTISGLIALTLMQFGLGKDLGLVLAKSIICSMLTVFLLMPGLILLFPGLINKTRHKRLTPDITAFGTFLGKHRLLFIIIFAIVLIPSFIFAGRVKYAFTDSYVTEIIPSEAREISHRIEDTFGSSSSIAILLPAGEYDKQRLLINDLTDFDELSNVTGLADIAVSEDHYLTDEFDSLEFSSLFGVAEDDAKLLFTGYSLEHVDLSSLLGGSGKRKVMLAELLIYLFQKIDDGTVSLDVEKSAMINKIRPQIERGVKLLHGKHYDRIVLTSDFPAQSEDGNRFVETLRETAGRYFEKDRFFMAGDITSTRDLTESYESDSLLIDILTIIFVFIILLITFRNPVTAAVMVFVIQGSIWINFAFTFLSGAHPSFVTHMIVSAIQMGATIDYAIVYMSRYLAARKDMKPKEAMAHSVNAAFPTILTSGAIMTVAGFLIAFRVSDVYVGHIGLAIGRGALTSVILVLTVLPQLGVLLDKLMIKGQGRKA